MFGKVVFVFLSLLFFQKAFSGVLPPENIPLPGKISSKKPSKIRSVFRKLKKRYKDDKGALWWLQFREGEVLKGKSSDVFCQNMEELSEKEEFPLHFLARIYFFEDCLSSPFFPLESFPHWLKPRAALASYRRGKKFGGEKEILEAAIYLGRYGSYKDLRVSYQKEAWSLAKKLKDNRSEEIGRDLFRMAPRLNPHPQVEDYLPMAHDFRKTRYFKTATDYYVKVLNSPETGWKEKNQAFKWLTWIYKRQNNSRKRLEISRQWSLWLSKEKRQKAWEPYYKKQLGIARRYWNLDQNTAALDLLDSLLKEEGVTVVKAEIHWMKGLIKIQEDLLPESLKEFELALKVIEKNKTKQALLEKILWRKAWILRERGQLKDSIRTLKKLKKITDNPYTRARVLFWIGENQRDLNRLFYSSKTFQSLRGEDPVGYYGLMACYRLKKDPLISFSPVNLPLEKINLETEDFLLTRWLIALKKKELLGQLLQKKKESLESQSKKDFKDWISLISLYQTTGKYLNIFQTFSLMSPEFQKIFVEDYGGLLFPLDFQKEVEQEALRQSLSPAMLFAVIRQESAFNRRARSPSDAFGLMQLIPNTARAMAKKIRKPYRGYGDLYNGEKNIILGTAYLKSLLSRYNGSFILAAAAYNAGGTPVRKWRAALDKKRPLGFIENIPYEETRTYIKLVLRNFVIYNKVLKDLYTLSREDRLLELLQGKKVVSSKEEDSLFVEKKDFTDKRERGNEKKKLVSYFPEWLFHVD